MRTELDHGTQDRAVVVWRRDQLVRAGFPPSLAARLAHDPRIDLHQLIGLTERGCSPELAVRILAPLDLGEYAA
jgi:hypothetical protein